MYESRFTLDHNTERYGYVLPVRARIAQLVKTRICNLWIAGSSPTADGAVFWYEPLASLSLQIASVGSYNHGKK